MNKQELIEKYESLKGIWNSSGSIPALECFLQDLYQLTEPKKVVIPKFVAERIEECKAKNYGIGECLTNAIEYAMPDEVIAWFDSDKATEKDKELLVATAYVNGYEVEQEKLYTVEIPNPNSSNFTYLHKSCSQIKLVITQFKDWKKRDYNHLTESEIRKDFEWAWQWAKPVEEER